MEGNNNTITVSKEDKCKYSKTEQEEEEEVSFCDFPLNINNEQNRVQSNNDKTAQVVETQLEEFKFPSTGSEMCAADQVFFQGQILPLRLSISSDQGGFKPNIQNANQFLSRSESMDHIGSIKHGKHNKSSTIRRIGSESRVPRSHFHPSPKPQIKISNSRVERVMSNRNQKPSMWDFCRLGVAKIPDMDLQELKVIRRNDSRIEKKVSTMNRNSSVNGKKCTILKEKKQRKMKFLSGCNCYVDETVDNSDAVMNKKKSKRGSRKNSTTTGSSTVSVKEDDDHSTKKCGKDEKVVIEMKMKTMQMQEQSKSHPRTYEWLKELSHANFPLYV